MFGLSDKLVVVLAAVIAAVSIFAAGYWEGYSNEKEKFDTYKAEVQALAKAQEERVKLIEARNKRLNEEAKNAYNTRLTSLRAYYGVRLGQSGGSVPKVSNSTNGAHGYSPDNLPAPAVLASQCAETTLTLVALQTWVSDMVASTE